MIKGRHMNVCAERALKSVKPGGTAGSFILSQQITLRDRIFLFRAERRARIRPFANQREVVVINGKIVILGAGHVGSHVARALAAGMAAELLQSARFYIEFYEWAPDEFELVGQYIYFLADVMKQGGDAEDAKKITDALTALLDAADEAAS